MRFVIFVASLVGLFVIMAAVLQFVQSAMNTNSEKGYIERNGKVVIKPQFFDARDFTEGLAAVYMAKGQNGDAGWGFINTSGTVVIPSKFREVDEFSEGLAAVEVGSNWGYIDKTGTIKIAPQFLAAGRFQDGVAAVLLPSDNARALAEDEAAEKAGKEDRHWGPGCRLIDKTGKIICTAERLSIDPTTRPFQAAVRFSEGLLPVSTDDGSQGYMGEDGTLKIKGPFDSACAFAEGVAPVRRGEEWGYIDKSGNWIIEPQFQDAQPFADGLAAVGTHGHWHFIDHSGKQAFVGEFNTAEPFSEGVAHVRVDQHNGLIDKTGHFVLDKTSCAGLHCGLAVSPSETWADQVGVNSVRTGIVYSIKDIKAGETISLEDLETREQAATFLPDGGFSSVKRLQGARASHDIKAGKALTIKDVDQ